MALTTRRLADGVLAAVSLVCVAWGQQQKQPQKYLPSRIGLFYLALWLVGRFVVRSRALSWLARYSLAYFCLVSLSRFFPHVLRLPPSALTGKNASTGEIPLWRRVLNAPFHLPERWMYQRVVDQSVKTLKLGLAPYNQLNQEMYLGLCPLLLGDEFLPQDVKLVCDVSNEFPNSHLGGGNSSVEYMCFPIWDQGVPTDVEAFIHFIDKVAQFRGGRVYFHCAFGIGRSSLAAAAVMIKRGLASTPDEALQLIRQHRPMVHWGDEPKQFMQMILPRLLQ